MALLGADGRTGTGKGEARRLRAHGKVPAVAYGKELASTLLAVSPKEVLQILQSERGANSVIEMSVAEGAKLLVMIRDYSYHPVHRGLEHVDFVQVKLDQPVNVDVPLHYTGKPAGVVAGGVIRQVYRTVPVSCLPDRIPLKIEIDIAHLNMSEHVATEDLKLAQGVTVRLAPEQTLIAIVAPEKEREEVAAVVAPGAPGAPAAAGAAPAAEAGKDAKAAPAAKTAAAPAKDAKKK
jgi:large subunit ribosomal protein L25